MEFQFITDFNISDKENDYTKNFVKLNTYSPTLEILRKEKPVIKKTDNKNTFSFDSFDTPKTDSFDNNFENKLNNEVDKMTDDDYQDFANLGFEVVDWTINKGFNIFGYELPDATPSEKKQQKRIKDVLAKILKKKDFKMNLEMLLVILLIGYGGSKFGKKVKKDSEKKTTKKNNNLKVVKNNKNEQQEKVIKEVKKETKKDSLIQSIS